MTFADVAFTQPDPELMIKLDRWWDENAPELWRHPGYSTERLHHLPVPDRPNGALRARLNTLYWPTGASRWGCMYALMNGTQVQAVWTALGTNPAAFGRLKLTETLVGIANGQRVSRTGTREFEMCMLDARPLMVGSTLSARTQVQGTNLRIDLDDPLIVYPDGGYAPQESDRGKTITISGPNPPFTPGTYEIVSVVPGGWALDVVPGTAGSVGGQWTSELTQTTPDYSRRLYLVTLVDRRYYWWLRPLSYTFEPGDSWETLLESVYSAMGGVGLTVDPVAAAYGDPQPLRWTVRNRPLPLVMDAAVASCGLRLAYYGDDTARAIGPRAAYQVSVSQHLGFYGNGDLVLGGLANLPSTSGNLPEAVSVTFWGDVPTATSNTLASLALPEFGSYVGNAGAKAFVGVDQRAGQTTPAPASVATQVATDYYLWWLSLVDATYRGVQPAEPTGLEDRIEWEWVPGRRPAIRPEDARDPVDPILPADRILTRVVPLDWHDRNLYGDRPPPGYTYAVELDSKHEYEDRWKATIQVADLASGELVDGPQLGWSEDEYVLYGRAGLTAGAYGTAVPDPLLPDRWAFVPGSSAFAGIVRLIQSGSGIDGGTAWGAKLMHEVAGNVVTSTTWLGDVSAAPWVLYPTEKGYDGRDGFPEAGDLVDAFPDPDRSGRWLFVPKTISPSDCGQCSWLANLPHETCLLFEQLGGGSDGMCNCFPVKSETVMVYHEGAPAGWRGIEMGTSCCGCGGMIFNVTTGSEDYDATLQMYRYHVGCGGGSGSGSVFTKNLKLECCGTDVLGRKFAVFSGWGTDPCEGTPAGCDNSFLIRITCGTCPTTSCTCDACLVCCEGQTPLGFYGDFFSFPDDNYNGYWSYAPVLGENCIWRAACDEYTSELVLTTELVGPAIVVKATLTHGTSVYTATDWNCCEGGDLTKESGDGPATVALGPLKVNGECPECVKVWPDVLYMEFYDIVESGLAVFPYPANTPIAMSKVAGVWTPTTGWQDDDTGLCNRFNCDAGGLPGCEGFGSNGGAIGTNGTQLDCTCTPIFNEESFLYMNTGPSENVPFSACPVGGGGNVGMIGDTISYKVRVME